MDATGASCDEDVFQVCDGHAADVPRGHARPDKFFKYACIRPPKA